MIRRSTKKTEEEGKYICKKGEREQGREKEKGQGKSNGAKKRVTGEAKKREKGLPSGKGVASGGRKNNWKRRSRRKKSAHTTGVSAWFSESTKKAKTGRRSQSENLRGAREGGRRGSLGSSTDIYTPCRGERECEGGGSPHNNQKKSGSKKWG